MNGDIGFQPVLSDGVIHVRPLRPDDWHALHVVAADPALWADHPARDRWQEPVFRTYFDAGLASGMALVIETADGTVAGSSRYGLNRAGDGEVEIGSTFIARRLWGSGINAAVKRLMIGHALMRYERAIFLVGEDNLRSRRAMEKIGGVLTPRRIDAVMAGHIVPHLVYAIDRAGFAAGPLAQG